MPEHNRRTCDASPDGHTSPCRLLIQRTEVEKEILAKIEELVEEFHSAFVNEDLIGHKNAHQSMIDANKAAENFWNELRLDLAKKSLWGLLMLLLGFAMLGLAAKFGIGGAR